MLARRVPMSNVHTVRAITRSLFTLMPHMFATVGSNCWPVWRRAPAAPFACNRRRLRRAQLTEEASFRPNRQTLAACPSSHGLRLGRDRGGCAQKKSTPLRSRSFFPTIPHDKEAENRAHVKACKGDDCKRCLYLRNRENCKRGSQS